MKGGHTPEILINMDLKLSFSTSLNIYGGLVFKYLGYSKVYQKLDPG